jgi:Tol biopolymer transport system component
VIRKTVRGVVVFACAALPPVASAQFTERVSVTTDGFEASQDCGQPSISADGRFVVFVSGSPIGGPPTSSGSDVFVHDRVTGTTRIVTLTPDRRVPNSGSQRPAISGDGRFVAFQSRASDLVSGDTNSADDVFVRDLVSDVTERVSVSTSGAQADIPSGSSEGSMDAAISGDGRYVAFSSRAANLVPGDTNGRVDVFVRDRIAGTTERVSLASAGIQANDDCHRPSISSDGRWVAFTSQARDLAAPATSEQEIYVRDRQAGTTVRASVNAAGEPALGGCTVPMISANGRFVVFRCAADNLDPIHIDPWSDVFVRDLEAGTTEQMSVDATSGSANQASDLPSISGDGRYVSFTSDASNLVADDTTITTEVFVRDRVLGVTVRAARASDGTLGDDQSTASVLSADGSFLAFASRSLNLVPNEYAHVFGIFVRAHPVAGQGFVSPGVSGSSSVLTVNGREGVVFVADRAPASAPGGPTSARYVLWIWSGLSTGEFNVVARGSRLGTTLLPTPLNGGLGPQPILCFHGTGLPAAACGSAPLAHSPRRAPWSLTAESGVRSGTILTLQGVLEDAAAANALGFSVTNAVVVVSP